MEKLVPTADMFMSLVEHSPDLVALTAFDGQLHYINPAGLDLVGLSSLDEAMTKRIRQFVTGRGWLCSRDAETSLRTRGVWSGESELTHFPTDTPIPVWVSMFVVLGAERTPLIASIQRDLRTHKQQQDRMQSALDSAAYLAAEQHAIADISRRALRGDLDDILAAATAAALTLIDAHCASIFRPLPGTDHLVVAAYTGVAPRPSRVAAGRRSQPGYALDTGETVVCTDRDEETRFATTSMQARGLRSGVSIPIPGDSGPWGVLTVHSALSRSYSDQEVEFLRTVCDVLSAAARRVELENRLRHRGMHDALTGLPNRQLILEHLGRALDRTSGSQGQVAVFLVDFDNFKSINDHFGHDIGDTALVAVARRLRDTLAGSGDTAEDADSETVSRLGGDEFLVVCEGVADAGAAEAVARSIGSALRAPLTIEGRSVPLSASIGIALSEKDIQVSQLVHRADVAMYRAKSSSPGKYAVFDADDDRQARHHLTMSTDLRAAIENDELTLRYCPMIDTSTGVVALLATAPVWEHPALGTLEADEFVTTAERTGLIEALGAWILRGACRDAAAWPTSQGPVRVRVDVVATQIRQGGFVATIAAALHSSGLPAERLVISIPESALNPADDDSLRATLIALRTLGVHLLLDNSSGGHSSIRNLQQFPEFEYFQLDSSDVDATFREHSAVVLRAVVALIHAIGAGVVAGAVDTDEHLAGVAAVGCDLALGTHLGGPLTAADAGRILQTPGPLVAPPGATQ